MERKIVLVEMGKWGRGGVKRIGSTNRNMGWIGDGEREK